MRFKNYGAFTFHPDSIKVITNKIYAQMVFVSFYSLAALSNNILILVGDKLENLILRLFFRYFWRYAFVRLLGPWVAPCRITVLH